MRYLSIDLEATGLEEENFLTEFAAICVDTQNKTIHHELCFHTFIQCPSFEVLRPNLSSWIIENMKNHIQKAHSQGISLKDFKLQLEKFLISKNVQNFFQHEKILLFGKSLSALDLPLLKKTLGTEFLRTFFSHQTLDVSCVSHFLVDKGLLPEICRKGSGLMSHFEMGEVAHTALEDARHVAELYFKMLEII